jgi:hypothetical protein
MHLSKNIFLFFSSHLKRIAEQMRGDSSEEETFSMARLEFETFVRRLLQGGGFSSL